MDSLITAAARALAAGDPLGALKRIALRDDAPALALRGIAMAQLGDFVRARILVRSAARAFGPNEAAARARCVVAEAEIALATRELTWPGTALEAAQAVLQAHGDRANAAYARYLQGWRLLLIGRLGEADEVIANLDAVSLPPALKAACEMAMAGISLRRLQAKAAREHLARAERFARLAGVPALLAEVDGMRKALHAPAARLISSEGEELLSLDGIESLLASQAIIVDACRLVVRDSTEVVSFARRPVLFALVRTLAEAWPGDVSRKWLIAAAFRTRYSDESHRVRLRVEIGRLRKLLSGLATVTATNQGFVLSLPDAREARVLAPPIEENHAAVLALLADGESWSSSGLALALSSSQRQVQRALDALAAEGKAQPVGRGRACRWIVAPIPAFATGLLLSASLPAE